MAVHPLRPATDRRLGEPLPHQLANQTRGHLSAHKALASRRCLPKASCGISSRFQLLSPTERQVPHALLTRSPLKQKPKSLLPFDLHVLGTPPAFVLSQDQTLKNLYLKLFSEPKIKFLNNLLLAKLLKNFRWLFFRLRLNNPFIVQGVFYNHLRYSIYKIQRADRTRG